MVLEKLIITRSINDIEMKYTYSLTKESLNNVQAYGIKVERVDIKDGAIINRVEDGVKYLSTYSPIISIKCIGDTSFL